MRLVAQSLWMCLALGVAIGVTHPARAEDRNPASARSDGSIVKDPLRHARRARALGKWTEAHAAYKAAFEAIDATSVTERESAEIAGELGLSELKLRKFRDAAEHLAWSLERRKALSPAQQRAFADGLAKAVPFLATLYVSVDPPDAEVFVGGKSIGRPRRTYTLFFEPGKHMVRALAPGRGESTQTLDAQAGTERIMTFQLLRSAESSAKDNTPAVPKPLSAPPAARPQAPGQSAWRPTTLRIAGIAATTATLSAGSLLMIRATNLDGDLSERRDGLNGGATASGSRCWQAADRPGCADLVRLRDERNLSAAVGTAMLIAGGVIGAATAASFFTDFSFLGLTPAQDRIHASPVATGREIGVTIEGLW
ncbi:hypothetical protein [Sorangium cellulosum]|uniref:PEGA domain-containing protein n=1 Tax=Sorangium cellulosum TaxID=56 RepID=A0A150R130_SORCE|nr:hypothetical protein [Sorangium cellulosum]KYF73841.1 hypothetical protein BE15_20145 [Sorangium cellulosum]